jgi:hypothetical protein
MKEREMKQPEQPLAISSDLVARYRAELDARQYDRGTINFYLQVVNELRRSCRVHEAPRVPTRGSGLRIGGRSNVRSSAGSQRLLLAHI